MDDIRSEGVFSMQGPRRHLFSTDGDYATNVAPPTESIDNDPMGLHG